MPGQRRAEKVYTLETKWAAALPLLVIVIALTFWNQQRLPQHIDSSAVRRVVDREARKHNLNSEFVFAIVFAESSFNAHADSGAARGIMQVSPVAWQQMTHLPYHKAYDWRLNIAVGTAYLGWLKERLEKQNRFSYPLLAASYHHGPGAVRAANYDLSLLPPTRNLTYREIYQGRIPQIQ
jgi:soluble lytic murein transglycosylase-like protein